MVDRAEATGMTFDRHIVGRVACLIARISLGR